MHEIICPHCNKAFKIDEAGYADILKQVRDGDFEKQLHERLELAEKEKRSALALAEAKAAADLQKAATAKDNQIHELQSKLEAMGLERQLAVTQALSTLERERDALANEIQQIKHDQQAAISLAEAKMATELQKVSANKEAEIQALKAQLSTIGIEQRLAISEAVGLVEKERDELRSGLQRIELEKHLVEKSLTEKYETQIKDREETIERLRDMKARLSTKMVGESLEQHCEIEFNRIRATGFPNAYFEKDNDARNGSKGDFIFRDFDPSGLEIVSIMFEMKNESDETSSKKKNEDFLKELDKDRTEKNCEYAVLVSLLEPENDLYNAGIVDVFHRYPKMYVVRPQFFIPIITLLRNASMKSLAYKSELALVKAQNVDITRFESQLDEFKTAFGRNWRLASEGFEEAIIFIRLLDRFDQTTQHSIFMVVIPKNSALQLARGHQSLAQLTDKLDAWEVFSLRRNPLVGMADSDFSVLHLLHDVVTELKCQSLVRTHALEKWQCGRRSLEVNHVQRPLPTVHLTQSVFINQVIWSLPACCSYLCHATFKWRHPTTFICLIGANVIFLNISQECPTFFENLIRKAFGTRRTTP